MVRNTMYPILQNPYVTKDARKFVKKQEDEESSASARPSENESERESYQLPQHNSGSVYERLRESKQAQEQAKTSLEANIKSATINIAQILKDFKSTAAAIATPPELNEEVNTYLALVQAQVTKEEPNTKIVKSNLKNAAALLDGYITETLQRPSKVVENWLDALFLQKINYAYNEGEVNSQFLVKFPGENKNQEPQTGEENPTQSSENKQPASFVPSDLQLKSYFIQGKKFAYANHPQKALEIFNLALNRAEEIQDFDTKSKIYFEIGKIYDKNDDLPNALNNYNQSASTSADLNVKTKAHYSMAQIYDDVAEFEPAINHYMTSISYAGESENITAQSASLTKIGNIFTDKYDQNAFDFYSEAENLSTETNDAKTKGYVSTSIANAYNKFNQPQKALEFYSMAIKEYSQAQSTEKVAQNYLKAGQLMVDYGNTAKAKSLLLKALQNAQTSQNTGLVDKINAEMSQLA